jgi:hypothetical protein
MKPYRFTSVFLIGLAAFMIVEWPGLAEKLGGGTARTTALYVIHTF